MKTVNLPFPGRRSSGLCPGAAQAHRNRSPQREKRITCNYRSRQPLINLVNGLFSRLMDKSAGSEIEYIDLSAQRPGPGPCAELLVCAPAEEETVAEAEARMLAARIAEMVAKREVTVGDRDGARPVRFGDIAVLIRSRTHLKDTNTTCAWRGYRIQ